MFLISVFLPGVVHILSGHASSQTRIALEKTIAIAHSPQLWETFSSSYETKKRKVWPQTWWKLCSQLHGQLSKFSSQQQALFSTESPWRSITNAFKFETPHAVPCCISWESMGNKPNCIQVYITRFWSFKISDRPHFLPCQTPSTVTICTFCLVASPILQPCPS